MRVRYPACGPGGLAAVMLALGLLLTGVASADERILSYHADIRIAADASMTVTETIRVHAEGQQIRRGIYRDFPTSFEDRFGNDYEVPFSVVSVQRNGQTEVWHTESRSNGVRIYMGSASRSLPVGEHTYALTYRTDRSIGYFESRDELYWNVTGTDWGFPIDEASARIVLPERIPAADLAVEGYTGVFGASGRDFTGSVQDGLADIRTTRPLQAREGLTVVQD